jgi:glucokinase
MTKELFLGVEIGGTKLQLGLGRGDGQLLAFERRSIRPEAGAQGILQQIAEVYETLLSRPSVGGIRPSAVGFGFGGPVDVPRGRTLKSHQISGWDGFELAEWTRRTLDVPDVAVQNDADVAGLGEALHGAGVGLSPLFYVTIGSGIGGGLILDGKIYEGSGTGAAEIGHLWIDDLHPEPRRLEDIASGWSIGSAAKAVLSKVGEIGPLEVLADGDPSRIDAALVARAASLGDKRAVAILSTATQAVGRALAHVVTLLSPRRIILGGGVSLIGEELWFEPIRSTLDARVFPPFRGTFDVVPAQLGEEVVLHGALALALGVRKTGGSKRSLSTSDEPALGLSVPPDIVT